MALVEDSWRLSFAFRDGSNSNSESVVHLPAATAEVDVGTFATSFAALLEPLSNAQLIGYNVAKVYRENAPAFDPLSNVREKIRLNFITNVSRGSSYSIPGCRTTILAANGYDLNTANADVQALRDAFITGIGGLAPMDHRGALMVALSAAYKQHSTRGTGGRKRRMG